MSEADKMQCLLKLATIAGVLIVFAAQMEDNAGMKQAQGMREAVSDIQEICECLMGKA